MAYTITKSCISCDRCQTQCPTGAIAFQNGRYTIDSNLCNDCAGYYSLPQCRSVCPTNHGCIPSNSLNQVVKFNQTLAATAYWENWLSTYNALVNKLQEKTSKPKDYWQTWFARYNTLVSKARLETIAKQDYWQTWFRTYEAIDKELKGTTSNYWSNWFDNYANTCQPIINSK